MLHLANDIRRVSSPDGAVLLDLGHGTMFRVNPMGSKILDLLEQSTPLAQIEEQLSGEFGVAREIVHSDLMEFLECLRLHGIANLQPEGE